MKVEEENQGNVNLGEVTTDNPMVEPPGVQDPVEETPPQEEPQKEVVEPEPQADGEPVEAQEYTPDLQYKVFDEQREFPEYVRSIIKDKDSEEQVRSLFCKADALEPMKEKYQGERTARESWEKRYGELDHKFNDMSRTVQEANHYAQTDLNSFFKFMGIKKDEVLKFAAEQLQYEELPQDQRQLIDQRSQQAQESFQYQTQLSDIQSMNYDLMKRQHDADMRDAISEPTIAEFRTAFEQAKGDGSFLKAINDYGDSQYLRTQQYVSPHQAVKAVYEQFSDFINNQPTQTQQTQNPRAVHTPPPTLPNVARGGGASPIKKVHKSLDELREFARNYGE